MKNAQTDLIEKIKKLAVLADQGFGGEKEAAAVILGKIMNKYCITEANLEEETMYLESFRYKDELQRKLLCQVFYMVLGDRKILKRKDGKGKQLFVHCTNAERIEVEVTFDFFKQTMLEELERFFHAFTIKNHLYPPPDKQGTSGDEQEISDQDYLKLSYMLRGMEHHTLRNMIEGKSGNK